MKQTAIIAILCLCIAAKPHAQAFTSIIKGVVQTGQKAPLAYAAVLLKLATDSSVYKWGLSAGDGTFVFNAVGKGSYFVEISAAGFEKKTTVPVDVGDKTIVTNLGIVTLTESIKMLGNVTVTAQKPFIERQIDKTVVNVDNSIVSAGTTVFEMLKKLPGVQVTDAGQITLNGKQGVNVFIDGKATYLSADDLANLLRGTQSSSIQTIEIMTKPPAKYDAAAAVAL